MLSWLFYVGVGKVLLFLGMKFPLPQFLEEKKTIKYLHECDLCFGFWVYAVLSWAMQLDLLTASGFHYVPVIAEIVTGGVVTFVMHLLRIGWNARFYPTLEI